MKGKIFTRLEATRMLPLVRKIVIDIVACQRLRERHERAIEDAAKDQSVLARLQPKIEALVRHAESCAKELESLGCFLVDPAEGVVRFYGERGGRIVYLSWTLGEPEVSHWYPINETHRERRPLDDDREAMTESAQR